MASFPSSIIVLSSFDVGVVEDLMLKWDFDVNNKGVTHLLLCRAKNPENSVLIFKKSTKLFLEGLLGFEMR